MNITDLECELFIDDLGNIQGGIAGPMPTPGSDYEVTTLALGEESGIEPRPPVNPVDGMEQRIIADVHAAIKSSLAEDLHHYLPF